MPFFFAERTAQSFALNILFLGSLNELKRNVKVYSSRSIESDQLDASFMRESEATPKVGEESRIGVIIKDSTEGRLVRGLKPQKELKKVFE